jgi:hypothetical protein
MSLITIYSSTSKQDLSQFASSTTTRWATAAPHRILRAMTEDIIGSIVQLIVTSCAISAVVQHLVCLSLSLALCFLPVKLPLKMKRYFTSI